ncbi:MAG: tetratricopeptide repeat protein [Betaproteobacteria bacterium]
MKCAVLVAALSFVAPAVAAPQDARTGASPAAAQVPATSPEALGSAYNQFLLGRHLEDSGDVDGAIAAYKRAMQLDPSAADVPAELAALYMRQNRPEDAIATAEQALKIGPDNREAHRVLGTVYAALADNDRSSEPDQKIAEYTKDAISHLEQALTGAPGEPDANLEAMLARLYLRTNAYDKAIPLLTRLVNDEPGWREGPMLLAQAYGGAGRTGDAIDWLEQAAPADPQLYPLLADFYEKAHRWKDAAGAYAKALQMAPRSVDLQTRYASALMNAGGRENGAKAKDVLTRLAADRPDNGQILYLLSQAERRTGDSGAAEATARKVIAQNPKSPWGYYALAEALEERQQFQAVVDALSPVIDGMRAQGTAAARDLSLLLPHVAFAYQQLGDTDKALEAFQQAHQLAPDDSAVTAYLIQANLAAKKYDAAVDLARQAHSSHPDDLRLATLEAQALQQSGKADEGIAVLQGSVKAHGDDPRAWVALGQLYADAKRGSQAIALLQEARTKFPSDSSVAFALGAVYDKEKRFADAETEFKQLLAREPDNALALNYLGYMLADRGERLDESVSYLKKAVQLEPDNGSFLDSLGWAYFKREQFQLAEDNLKRAAGQLRTNSVVQDHYGELLFKLGRYDEAIAAWNKALAGDGQDIDRKAIDRKIRDAKQKLEKR